MSAQHSAILFKRPTRHSLLARILVSLGLVWLSSCCELLGDCDDDPVVEESGSTVVLNVPFRAQQTQVWCWSATSEMVLSYEGNPIPQCQIVSNWTGGLCCSFPSQQCFITAPDVYFIQATLGFEGLSSGVVSRPLTFAEVRAEIDSGDPMIVAYTSSFSGHVVVIYGYDEEQEGGPYIAIHDPLNGSFLVPYAVAGLYSGSGVWSSTIVTDSSVSFSSGSRNLPFEQYPTIMGEELQHFEALNMRALESLASDSDRELEVGALPD